MAPGNQKKIGGKKRQHPRKVKNKRKEEATPSKAKG